MQHVYWSDVRERKINRVKLDGSSRRVVLSSSNGIGVVDGTALQLLLLYMSAVLNDYYILCLRQPT